MIKLQSDYNSGAHPKIMEAINKYNNDSFICYGEDEITNEAKKEILKYLKTDSDIYFVVGGTSANQIAISSALKPYEGVLALPSGHINVHEAGAIEATGHKVLTLSDSLLINPKEVKKNLEEYAKNDVKTHMVKPQMVYVSIPGENGLVLPKKDLEELYRICQEKGVYLYIDGARMAYALSSEYSLEDFAKNSDIMYIGGTKCGLLFGEAIVINNPKLKEDFSYNIKQRGGLLAKGFLLGIQFKALFEDGLYMEIGRLANNMSSYARSELSKLGMKFYYNSLTNQIFPIASKKLYEKLEKEVSLEKWFDLDKDNLVFRIVTTYKTKRKEIDYLVKIIKENI